MSWRAVPGRLGRHAEQADLGANQGAVGLIEVQQFQALVIAGQLQVLADEATGQALQAAVFQVHRQEPGVGVHVGEAERFVELDAVEDHDLAVNYRSVAQVDITVAFADETLGLALGEQWLEAFEAAFGPGLQGVQLQQVGLVAEERADLLEVLPHRGHDAVRGPGFVFCRHARCVEVEAGDLLSHLVDVRGGQFAIGLQRAEQTVLRKLAHFQGVLDGRAFAAQLRCFGAAGDRQHFEIQILGQALVQAQLFSAEMLASLEAGEVEEAEIHSASSLYKQRGR